MILKGNLNIKVVYNNIRVDNDDEIQGNWSFQFVANKDKLMGDVKTIIINRKFTLENGQVVTIENIRVSPSTTTLNYTMELPNGKDISSETGLAIISINIPMLMVQKNVLNLYFVG